MKIMKKVLSVVVMFALIVSLMPANSIVKASQDEINEEQVLLDYGVSEKIIESLSELEKQEFAEELLMENPDFVDVQSSVLEIDNLAEIEEFMSQSDEDWIEVGADPEAVATTREDLNELYDMTDEELSKEKDISMTEARFLRKAVEKGKENRKKQNVPRKEMKNPVTASGSISSSKLTYTQSVSGSSTGAPSYKVNLSYNWNSEYVISIFSDKIIAEWGGSLTTKGFSTAAHYYTGGIGKKLGKWFAQKSMSRTESPNRNIQFTFPQSVKTPSIHMADAKTDNGKASFTLYQTKRAGKDTKFVSRFGHRIISVKSAGISFSSGGVSGGLSFGGAWDQTPQKVTTIKY